MTDTTKEITDAVSISDEENKKQQAAVAKVMVITVVTAANLSPKMKQNILVLWQYAQYVTELWYMLPLPNNARQITDCT